MANISAQNSKDLSAITIDNNEDILQNRVPTVSSSSSESTFTRRTTKIHTIIKELLLIILAILTTWQTIKMNSK